MQQNMAHFLTKAEWTTYGKTPYFEKKSFLAIQTRKLPQTRSSVSNIVNEVSISVHFIVV